MTNTCQLKRGFFVMRECPAPVAKQCPNCQRFVCQHHFADASDANVCVECARNVADNNDEYWIYANRQRYYEEGYEPFIYTDEDYTSFDTLDDGPEIWDDDYAGDFHDS